MSLHLWTDGVDVASVNTLPENGDFKARGDSFIKKQNPFSYMQDRLVIADGCAFDLHDGSNWRQVSNRGDMVINPASVLEEGDSFTVGTDYFIYLLLNASKNPEIAISRNATFPLGFTAENSRKIGGFHYGSIRKVDDSWTPVDSLGTKYGAGGTHWRDNVTVGIIPNSVWDLKNRPKTLFGGLVKVGNIWMSIYQASIKVPVTFMDSTKGLHVSGGELQSVYGQMPATGTEGLCQYNFVELASRAGMRLPSYQEWLAAAMGNPQGEDAADNYGWTKKTNIERARTGCCVNPNSGVYDAVSGIKKYAVSAFNCVDCVGNVWENLSDYIGRFDAGTGTWGYQDQLGSGMGQVFEWKADGLSALRVGGNWNSGVCCGSRAVYMSTSPWILNSSNGCRLACDPA